MPKFIYIGNNVVSYMDLIDITIDALDHIYPIAEPYTLSLIDDVYPPGEIMEYSTLDHSIPEIEIFNTTIDIEEVI